MRDKILNDRNWERLLISTLKRVRYLLPGPGPIKQKDYDAMSDTEKKRFDLGEDIDEILKLEDERNE